MAGGRRSRSPYPSERISLRIPLFHDSAENQSHQGHEGRLLTLRKGLSALVLLLLAGLSLHSQPLYGEFWVRRDLLEIVAPGENVRETGEYSDRERQAIETLLEDARWAFSGMIYGFDVRWTPSASSRDVEEQWILEPVGLIPRGDPRLKAAAVVEENGFVYIRLSYSPDELQAARLEGWKSQAYPAASGLGETAMFSSDRREAMEEAMKQAMRAWLRAREYNRPREVVGRVALLGFPEIGMSRGALQAKVSIRMDLEPLRHYAAD